MISPLATYQHLTDKTYNREGHRIDRITPHCIVGQWSAKFGCDWFATNGKNNSVNYVVGKDGDIGCNVDEDNGAWTSSSNANDMRAITIEIASDATSPYAVTDKAYAAVLDLITDICKRYNIDTLLWIADKNTALAYEPKENEMILTVHRWFANKSCPGDYLYSRMGAIAEEVTKRLGGKTPTQKEPISSYPSCPFLVRVKVNDLNIRNKANGTITGKYTGKGIFTITQVDGDWGHLKSGIGWIYLANPSYVEIQGTVANTTVTTETTSGDETLHKYIWNALSNFIDNDFGVAGLMGNLYAESGLISNNLQNVYNKALDMSDADYTAKVDNGLYKDFVFDRAGYGLAQWTYQSRKMGLLALAHSKSVSIGNLDMQLEYLEKELHNYGLIKKLNAATSVLEASNVILHEFEKPADQTTAVELKRAEYGEKFYNQYHKEPVNEKQYRVQCGVFNDWNNAKQLELKLKEAGFDSIVVEN